MDASRGCLIDLDHAKYTRKFSRHSRQTDVTAQQTAIVKTFLAAHKMMTNMEFTDEVISKAIMRFPDGMDESNIYLYIRDSGTLYMADKTPSKPISLHDLGWNSNVSSLNLMHVFASLDVHGFADGISYF